MLCWRILFRFFLEGNSDLHFREFLQKLPSNWIKLDLDIALKTVVSAYQKHNPQEKDKQVLIVLGLDEFQFLYEISLETLQAVIVKIASFMCDTWKDDSPIKLCCLMAGTFYSPLAEISRKSKFEIKKISLPFLSFQSVLDNFFAESINSSLPLFKNSPTVRIHILQLGGVPDFIVAYIKSFFNQVISDLLISFSWSQVEDKMQEKFQSFRISSWCQLISYSITGQTIIPTDKILDTTTTFEEFESFGGCSLIENQLILPHSYMYIASSKFLMTTEINSIEYNLLYTISQIKTLVNDQLYSSPLHYLWEVFGACYKCLRINSFLYLKKNVLHFQDFHSGAVFPKNFSNPKIQLQPCTLIFSKSKFSKEIRDEISSSNSGKFRWKEGNVFLNDTNGEGIDIFNVFQTTLDGLKVNGTILDLDQRKRQTETLVPQQKKQEKGYPLLNYFEAAKALVPKKNKNYAVGIFNVIADTNNNPELIPDNCYFVSSSESQAYYLTFFDHPIIDRRMNINDPLLNETWLAAFFNGKNTNTHTKIAKIIIQLRNEKPFTSQEDLINRIQEVIEKHKSEFGIQNLSVKDWWNGIPTGKKGKPPGKLTINANLYYY